MCIYVSMYVHVYMSISIYKQQELIEIVLSETFFDKIMIL